jgi:hypothetical protein
MCRDRIYHLYYPGTPMGTSLWILVFGGCQIFLSLVSGCKRTLMHPTAIVSKLSEFDAQAAARALRPFECHAAVQHLLTSCVCICTAAELQLAAGHLPGSRCDGAGLLHYRHR